ncbi:MAG: CAP domain-containing protein, partial [Ardenticatenales bacterium]
YSMGCRPTAPITMPRPVALATLIALFAVPFIAPHHAFADSPAADPNAAAEAPAAEQAAPEPPASAETHAAPSAPDTAAALAAPDFDTRTRLELEVLGRVNAVRAEHGLGPLQLDDRLVAAAREQAVDMAYHNYCRHTGSDGSRVRDRLRRHGYPYNNWAGENIICARRTADAAMTWWLHSAPHRANILHGHFTHIGVGVSMLGTYGPDFVLTFAAGDANTVEAGAFKALREGNVAGWIDATREPDRRPR